MFRGSVIFAPRTYKLDLEIVGGTMIGVCYFVFYVHAFAKDGALTDVFSYFLALASYNFLSTRLLNTALRLMFSCTSCFPRV